MQHPTFLTLEAEVPGAIGAVSDFADDYRDKSLRPLIPANLLQEFPDANDAQKTLARKLFNLLINGSTFFAIGQPVLRLTKSISNFYNGSLPGIGGNEFLVQLNDIGITNPTIARLAAGIAAGPANVGYLWSWRQLGAQASTSGYNRVEISREWWWGNWSTLVYQMA